MKLLTVSFGSVLAFILLFSTTNVSAQEIYVGATVKNGDTLLVEHLPTAQVTAYRNRKYRNTWKYKKTVQRVKKVYPYATLGAELYENYLEQSADFETKKERRKFLKTEEKKLKSKFEGKIRDVTIKEGIILVKLIDRQTNYTS